MAVPYQEKYRQGVHSGLHSDIRRTLGQLQQQEALAGRPMNPSERASILKALYGNYADVYGRGYERAGERQEEEGRYEETFQLQKDQLQQQQEAAEMQGYAQMAQLGLAGTNLYMQSGSGGGGGAAGGGTGTTTSGSGETGGGGPGAYYGSGA